MVNLFKSFYNAVEVKHLLPQIKYLSKWMSSVIDSDFYSKLNVILSP